MNTLTERYVHEVVRRVPADQRDDIADELRTTIADTVEARDAADPAAAERAVITEMGDPIRLAARYADRPLALIGPEFYPTYIRLLRLLLVTVLPVVTAVVVVLDVLDNNDIGSAIGSGIGAVLTVGAQMIAWLTVVFALIDRSRGRAGVAETTKWTPDDLPDTPRAADKRVVGALASAVWNLALIGLIVWQRTAEPYQHGGDRMQVLDPDLWAGWIWPILAGLAGVVVLELVRAGKGRWTLPLALPYALAEILFALPLAWVLHQQMLFNPDFLAAVNGDDWTIPDSFYTVTILVVLAISAGEIVKRFREARA
ncbi:permease prefix domain 1-containing protein [Spirillospora sp. NPDC029432]|uniref:HAAS signaling domain-containing protein n=1 Tax=Spirillospora sp. NPDC029432 TaxID=3154599 RepID=UPI003454BE08